MRYSQQSFLQEYILQIRKITTELEENPEVFADHDFSKMPAGIIALERTKDIFAMRDDLKKLQPNWFQRITRRLTDINITEI
jgi:hypothetical protein